CASIEARLPTTDEWTKALGGRRYPWGDVWPPPSPVAINLPEGASWIEYASDTTPSGVKNIAGGIQEWTSTVKDGLAIVRGGSVATDLDTAKQAIDEGLPKFTAAAAGANPKKEAV